MNKFGVCLLDLWDFCETLGGGSATFVVWNLGSNCCLITSNLDNYSQKKSLDNQMLMSQ